MPYWSPESLPSTYINGSPTSFFFWEGCHCGPCTNSQSYFSLPSTKTTDLYHNACWVSSFLMNKRIYPLIWDWYRIIYFSLLALPRFATKQERGKNTAWGKTSQALLHSASILTLILILGLWTRVSHWTISGAGRAAFLGLKLDWPWRRLSVLRQNLSMQLWLVWNLLCSQGDPEQRDLLNSASWMLGLRACTITSG